MQITRWVQNAVFVYLLVLAVLYLVSCEWFQLGIMLALLGINRLSQVTMFRQDRRSAEWYAHVTQEADREIEKLPHPPLFMVRAFVLQISEIVDREASSGRWSAGESAQLDQMRSQLADQLADINRRLGNPGD